MEENSKKTRVREMFDSIAPRYDLLNHLLSFGVDRLWRRRMVGVVAAGTPAAILDVAAGTGDVAVALARRLPAARITGIDLSGEMLAVGRGKVARRGLCDRIELVQGDAEQLPFPDGTFDAVTIGFGIRNFGSIEAGLAEAFRVLRPRTLFRPAVPVLFPPYPAVGGAPDIEGRFGLYLSSRIGGPFSG